MPHFKARSRQGGGCEGGCRNQLFLRWRLTFQMMMASLSLERPRPAGSPLASGERMVPDLLVAPSLRRFRGLTYHFVDAGEVGGRCLAEVGGGSVSFLRLSLFVSFSLINFFFSVSFSVSFILYPVSFPRSLTLTLSYLYCQLLKALLIVCVSPID